MIFRQPKVIAVDFDGCLFTDKWPEIGEPIEETITALKYQQAKGAKIILWTSRTGEMLVEAERACNSVGIYFDVVNRNLISNIHQHGTDSRKICADEYWDDRAVKMPKHNLNNVRKE